MKIMKKESKLEKIGEEGKIKKKSKLVDVLETIGLGYSVFLGTTTLGAIGGAVYSLCTGDNTGYWAGPLLGAAVEPFIILGAGIYIVPDCEW